MGLLCPYGLIIIYLFISWRWFFMIELGLITCTWKIEHLTFFIHSLIWQIFHCVPIKPLVKLLPLRCLGSVEPQSRVTVQCYICCNGHLHSTQHPEFPREGNLSFEFSEPGHCLCYVRGFTMECVSFLLSQEDLKIPPHPPQRARHR